MVYYLIVCRSLTYAQRTAAVLERVGVAARLMRSPRIIAGDGCGYSVKIAERNLALALTVLAKQGLSPKRVFLQNGDGSYQEVGL